MERTIVRAVLTNTLLLICFFSFFICGHYTHAQSTSIAGADISLETIPQYPEPESDIFISLNDYNLNSVGSTIQWYINDKELTQSKNERSIRVHTGKMGETQEVKVVLSRTRAPVLTKTLHITPNIVDIILEAKTYVPPFYKGRALPSSESLIRAIALVHNTSGGIKTTYTYKWSLDDTVLFGGPMKGKYILEQPVPLFGGSELTVEVFDANNVPVGKKSIGIEPVEPELYFYEYTPLRGLSERAATNPLTLISEETIIFGEPYYMNTRMSDTNANFTWHVDGKEVSHDSSAPNMLTVRRNGSSGQSSLSLDILTKTKIQQYVMNSLSLVF